MIRGKIEVKGVAHSARLTVFRFDPNEGTPLYRDYQVPLTESLTVMGALFYLNGHVEDPPAFRRFLCNRGQCAGCVMTIDGQTRRACTTRLRDGMVLEPLQDYPVIKDLVVDFGTKTKIGDDHCVSIRTGSFVLSSKVRWPKSLTGPWVYMSVDEEKCPDCAEKPCVRACPVNQIENLEDRSGFRLPPFSAPILIEDGRAKLAGVCNICSTWLCAAKCPTQAFRVVVRGAGTRIDPKKCIGCGLCVNACTLGNIWLNLERGYAVKCDLCRGEPKCVEACPYGAIRFDIIEKKQNAG